ncbi:hypothetical protein [uncultured Brachyspira sp.]|uniref:hypothetical protein n=1 Tax=uncultured Brachyspira sp. TaxID=221953 RepID=UPI0032206A00
MRKILFLLTILVFLIVSCNKRDSIEEHLGSIYYDINDETKETNYLYLDKSGTRIYGIYMDSISPYPLFYKYDSNDIYVFENTEIDSPEPTAFFLNKDRLTIIESFYKVKPTKIYKLLDKDNEYYSIANEYEQQLDISYNKSNFINGKEPYEKRKDEFEAIVKSQIERLKNYKSLEKDFENLPIIERYYSKFAVLFENENILSIACKIEDARTISAFLINPDIVCVDCAPSKMMNITSISYDKNYAYINFEKLGIAKSDLISIEECPVCLKSESSINEELSERFRRSKVSSYFIYNIYTRQFECLDCYRDYLRLMGFLY